MKILVSSIVDLKKSAHYSRLHQFLDCLSRKHEISVISINDWWKESNDNNSKNYNQEYQNLIDKIDYTYLTEKRVSPIIQELYAAKKARSLLKNIDYERFDVHFNYNTICSGNAVAHIMKSAGINTVYDIADDLPEMIRESPQIPAPLRGVGGYLGEYLMNKNIKEAEKITLTTACIGNSYSISPDKIEIVPNGVDTELFRKRSPEKIRNKYGLNDTFVIGYVGVLREWVDLNPLFVAIKNLRKKCNIKLMVVGGGVGYEKSVKYVKDCGLEKNVIFTGTIPYTQVPEYISAMDVCVVPFKTDAISKNSLPLKLFEYMACEKPVISTKIDGVLLAVENLVLYASNSKEYEEQILELYCDDELRDIMGVQGRKFVERYYTWTNINEHMENILSEV